MTETLNHKVEPNRSSGLETFGLMHAAVAPAYAPLCLIPDDDSSFRHFLSLILHGAGVDAQEFAHGAPMRRAVARDDPELIFLDVGLDSTEAIESVIALGQRGYSGFVQLMSGRGGAVLEHVKSVGRQHRLQMLPVLKKPFGKSAIDAIMRQLEFGHPVPLAARVSLHDALEHGWIGFWYQPKIDLRRKQLVGVE